MNYVFDGNEILLHGAKEGHKMANVHSNENVCFTVVGNATFLPGRSTSAYESIIVSGKASIVASRP